MINKQKQTFLLTEHFKVVFFSEYLKNFNSWLQMYYTRKHCFRSNYKKTIFCLDKYIAKSYQELRVVALGA